MPKKNKNRDVQNGIGKKKIRLPAKTTETAKRDAKNDDEIQTRHYLSLADTALSGEGAGKLPPFATGDSKKEK